MLISNYPPTKAGQVLVLRGEPLSIAEVYAVGRNRQKIAITDNTAVIDRMRAAELLVHQAVEQGQSVYGVTTGFGGMADVPVPAEHSAASQNNLLAFLSAGAGRSIDCQHVRAAMLLRANMLLRGVSGVRLEIVDRLMRFLKADAVPIVRELGSIGASGDLVPLSVIARAITGQHTSRVRWKSQDLESKAMLVELNLEPLELQPKEALAIVNGTSFSSAIAANCVHESRQLLAIALSSQAMMLRALCGNEEPFHAFVHQCKPHRGQVWTAKIMRRLLAKGVHDTNGKAKRVNLQDRYSLRCLPQYFGPIVEGIARVADIVHTEMNAVTDNPLIDVEEQSFHQSGNFLGQYIGMAMDDLRRYLGLLAKHLDVQIAQLVSPEFSQGLPASLQGNSKLPYNMGLKGLQITGNSIMPLLTYYGNPLVEHFPTHAEQYNQNVNGLSWGAANLAWQSVELFQQYSALALIFAVQALDLRAQLETNHYDGREMLGSITEPLYAAVYETLGATPGRVTPLIFNDEDQSLELQVAALNANLRSEGSVVAAIAPVLEQFDQANLGC